MTEPYSTDELTPYDLQTYTQGRLVASDPNVQVALDFALEKVRNHCHWTVSPVETVQNMDFDGPGMWGGLAVGIGGLYYSSGGYLTGVLRRVRTGADILYLPTKRLLSITSIVEDGVSLDVSQGGDISFSRDGAVIKNDGSPWTYNMSMNSQGAQGISVSFEHGYTPEQAADWRRIVLMIADRASMVRGLIGAFSTNMGPYRVNAYFGESRTGTLPKDASWLDDLLGMIPTKPYVRVDDW
jgi:hypothetical protein